MRHRHPLSCDDGDTCTTDTLVGGGSCDAHCTHAPITAAHDGDGCCPRGANANTDDDCTAECGNGVVEPGEECDDGNTADNDGCSQDCKVEHLAPTAFRIDSMVLDDPDIYVNALGCFKLTSTINTQIATNLTGDANSDGLYDLSPVLVFRPLAQHAASSDMDFLLAACKVADGSCSGAGITNYAAPANNHVSGVCLQAAADHTNGAAVNKPTNNCFVNDPVTLQISLQGALITLQDAQIAAVYSADPATGLTTGLIRGFLSQADADATTLPASIPLVGGQPVAALLGGDEFCGTGHNDEDTYNGARGWFFYLNFTATKVPSYTE